MRLTLCLLGVEVFDLALNETAEVEAAEPDDDRGSCTTYPIGFTRDPDVPWEDRGSLHQFDPEPDGEDI